MSKELKYENFVVRLKVKDAKDSLERTWGETVGVKAYNKAAKIGNKLIPIYNRMWYLMYPSIKGEYYPDKHPNYKKYYVGFLNLIVERYLQKHGGLNYVTKRKVCVNVDYTMKPTGEYKDGFQIYEADDMISIKDFGA